MVEWEGGCSPPGRVEEWTPQKVVPRATGGPLEGGPPLKMGRVELSTSTSVNRMWLVSSLQPGGRGGGGGGEAGRRRGVRPPVQGGCIDVLKRKKAGKAVPPPGCSCGGSRCAGQPGRKRDSKKRELRPAE